MLNVKDIAGFYDRMNEKKKKGSNCLSLEMVNIQRETLENKWNQSNSIQQETGCKCHDADIKIVVSAHVSGRKTHKGQIKKTVKTKTITLLVLRYLIRLLRQFL